MVLIHPLPTFIFDTDLLLEPSRITLLFQNYPMLISISQVPRLAVWKEAWKQILICLIPVVMSACGYSKHETLSNKESSINLFCREGRDVPVSSLLKTVLTAGQWGRNQIGLFSAAIEPGCWGRSCQFPPSGRQNTLSCPLCSQQEGKGQALLLQKPKGSVAFQCHRPVAPKVPSDTLRGGGSMRSLVWAINCNFIWQENVQKMICYSKGLCLLLCSYYSSSRQMGRVSSSRSDKPLSLHQFVKLSQKERWLRFFFKGDSIQGWGQEGPARNRREMESVQETCSNVKGVLSRRNSKLLHFSKPRVFWVCFLDLQIYLIKP